MLEKLRIKMKDKIRGYLGINVLESEFGRYKRLNDHVMLDQGRHLKSISIELDNAQEKIESLHNTVTNVVSFGSDICHNRYGESSWAVVCVEGKVNVVKFLDLSRRDADDVLRVLKTYEGGRYVNDTPMSYFPKDMFIDWK